ncbi:hypothetical protein B0J17DRAFT_707539 [Rhizoctonia solani]|nr:hypothetical protein B0J17DRAFT_707539 [Rhizoctonia solani]
MDSAISQVAIIVAYLAGKRPASPSHSMIGSALSVCFPSTLWSLVCVTPGFSGCSKVRVTREPTNQGGTIHAVHTPLITRAQRSKRSRDLDLLHMTLRDKPRVSTFQGLNEARRLAEHRDFRIPSTRSAHHSTSLSHAQASIGDKWSSARKDLKLVLLKR